MWLIFGISALICSAIGQEPDVLAPRVTITQGVVVGTSAGNGTHFEFYGIPYADSTSGSNRFKAPSAPPHFQEEFVANRQDVKCVRALGVGFEGTEDCLVVNIMTPSLNTSRRLPVMVWVKGKELDKTYLPELPTTKFMEKDVVIVSLNYRESILGFLCLGTENAPGNAGLKDIIAGLRWVQDNIESFGGDPENVLLFGHGSGAGAVDLVTLSPMSDGLVHKAIAQSGTALSPWAVTRNNLKYAIEVATALGHVVTDIQHLSDVFTRTHISALMAVINELELTDNSLAFAPCIEKNDLQNVEPFLIDTPYQTIRRGQQLSIPFLTGFVDIEGTIRADEAIVSNWAEKMDESFADFIQPDLYFINEERESQIAHEIKTFYFGDSPVNSYNLSDYLLYHGDTMVLVSAIREARLRAETSNADVYLYQFSYKGELGDMFIRPVPIDAAGHNEELAYIFYNEENFDVRENDLIISTILIERWTNFAKTGIPSSETSTVEWEPFSINNENFLRILDDDEIIENEENYEVQLVNPYPATMTFWDNIYNRHFIDAFSRWDISERNDESEVIVDEGEDEDDSNNDNDNLEVIEEVDETEDENASDSATSLTTFTFTIIALFAILEKLHMIQVSF